MSNNVEFVQPNKRLDQARLAKLNSIGFAWSAKTQRKSPLRDSISSQENASFPQQKEKLRKSGFDEKESARHVARGLILEAHWDEMYERLVQYKNEHGVSRSLLHRLPRPASLHSFRWLYFRIL